MELIFVRHAEPILVEASAEVADPPLSARGIEQADAAGAWLAGEDIAAIVHSPARRTTQTAEIIAHRLALTPTVDARFLEFNFGEGDYLTVEEMKARNDPRFAVVASGQLYGVDAAQYQATLVEAAEDTVAAHPGAKVVVVSHAGAINCYTAQVASVAKMLWIPPAFASITRVGASRDGRRGIVSINETGHLRKVNR